MEKINLGEYVQARRDGQLDMLASSLHDAATLERLHTVLHREMFRYTQTGSMLYTPFYAGDAGVYTPISLGIEPDEEYSTALAAFSNFEMLRADNIRDAFARDVDALAALTNGNVTIKTEGLGFSGSQRADSADLIPVEAFAWNSPVIDLKPYNAIDGYMGSLVSRYARKMRQAWKQSESYTSTHDFCVLHDQPHGEQMLHWLLENLGARRRYDQWPYALAQLLFAFCAPAHWFQLRDSAGLLLSVGYYVPDGDTLMYQGIVTSADRTVDNIGYMNFLAAIAGYYDGLHGYSRIDPTAETQPSVTSSVDQYKRVVGNRANYRGSLFGSTFEDGKSGVLPPFYNREWTVDDERFVLDAFTLKETTDAR